MPNESRRQSYDLSPTYCAANSRENVVKLAFKRVEKLYRRTLLHRGDCLTSDADRLSRSPVVPSMEIPFLFVCFSITIPMETARKIRAFPARTELSRPAYAQNRSSRLRPGRLAVGFFPLFILILKIRSFFAPVKSRHRSHYIYIYLCILSTFNVVYTHPRIYTCIYENIPL